jgi:hypothetical protein
VQHLVAAEGDGLAIAEAQAQAVGRQVGRDRVDAGHVGVEHRGVRHDAGERGADAGRRLGAVARPHEGDDGTLRPLQDPEQDRGPDEVGHAGHEDGIGARGEHDHHDATAPAPAERTTGRERDAVTSTAGRAGRRPHRA